MMDDKAWMEPCQAEELAHLKGEMALGGPESFTAEEKWEVQAEMSEVSIAV